MRAPERILASMPTALVAFGPDGTIWFANARAAEVLERPPDELLGGDVTVVFGAGIAELGDDRSELDVEMPSGATRPIGLELARDGEDVVVVFQDLSQVRRLRGERDRLMSMAAIGEALPSLLHELKNPLAAVTTAVEVLLEEVGEGPVQAELHAILTEVRRMGLGFEGIGAVHRPLRARRHAAIDHACREACRVLAARAKTKGITLRCDVTDIPLLPLDPAVMRAMLFNFVTNAIHACEEGDEVRVELRLEDEGATLRLGVSDTGCGMTPDVRKRATDLFFTTKASGSGIGLALCRRAAEEAGGTLHLASAPGAGTCVEVRVPLPGKDSPLCH